MNAIVVNPIYKDETPPIEETLDLIVNLDYCVIEVLTINLKEIIKKTYLGSGNVDILKKKLHYVRCNVVIFNCELSSLQVVTLKEMLNCEVYDRTYILLNIFKIRATSKEAKARIEIAILQYVSAQLVDAKRDYEQESGGSSINRGSGEKAIDLNRYQIRKQIYERKKKLLDADKQKAIRKANRLRKKIPHVAVVGYTNAGKSTFINAFLKASNSSKEVTANDRLFDTLDIYARKIQFKNYPPFIISDTIGFISNLPYALMPYFEATFEEIKGADLVIIVVDRSDANYQDKKNLLEGFVRIKGIPKESILTIYSKMDLVDEEIKESDDPLVYCSIKDDNLTPLFTYIADLAFKDTCFMCLYIPYQNADDYHLLRRDNILITSEEKEKGYYVEARVLRHNIHQFAKYTSAFNDID